MELYELTASELSKMLRDKKCSAQEIKKSVFSRIHSVENKVNAYLTLTEDLAEQQANEADRRFASGEENPPALLGIPIGIKDNICTKDILTTCASKMLNNFIPPYDATVVKKLRENGVVFTGKLNMDEFAMGSSCETSYFKKTSNPHNLSCVPGGSSGGSAAAVSAAETILSLGSDTGGSIRLPASYCGIVGLKPTYGSVSRFGLIAFASSLDQIGPMGRSVADVAMLYFAICGQDGMDATTAKCIYPEFSDLQGNIKGLTIGIPKEYYSSGINSEVKDKVLAAAKLLEENGAILKDISLPSTDYALSAYYIISSAEASSNLARFDGVKYGYRTENYHNLIELYENTRSEGFGDEVKRRILLGTFVLSSGYYDAYYKRAKLLQKQIAAEFTEAFQSCDILLTPTGTDTAFQLGEKQNDPLKMYANDVCTVTINIAGLPAISLPCSKASNNMPIGMQLIAPKFAEQRLFAVSSVYEKLVGGFTHIPKI